MLAIRAGITFSGKRDSYAALGYKRELFPEDFIDRYRRGDIAARIVEAEPKATWRGGVEILEDEDPTVETEFEQEFLDFSKRLNLWSVFTRADILAGLGQFSVVLIGAPGMLEEPLPDSIRPEEIAYLAPYGQDSTIVQAIEIDTASPRFGLPTQYQLKRLAGATPNSTTVVSRMVHWTRILHIADNRLDDRVFGNPRLQRIWNRLDDLDKVLGGGSEAFWKRADQGIIFDMDKDLEWDPAEVAKVKEAADEFMHGYRRMFSTRGMKAQQMGSDVADFSKSVDSLLTVISGATGIPKRILVGSERGELASTQDRENWQDRIGDRRHDFGEGVVLRPFIDRMIEHNVFAEPEDIIIRWPEIEHLDELEKADVADKWSKLNSQSGGVVVTASEIRDRVLRLDPLTPEQLAEEDAEQPVSIITPAPGATVDPQTPVTESDESHADTSSAAPPRTARALTARDVRENIRTRSRGKMRYHAKHALRSMRRGLNRATLRRALVTGHSDVLIALSGPLTLLRTGMRNLERPMAEAHHLTRKAIRAGKYRWMARQTDVSDKSISYAAKQAVDLITDLDRAQRAEISALLERAAEKDWSTSRLASNLESILGLNERQVGALDNLREKLENAQPGDIIEFGSRSARIPADGGSDAWIDKQVDRYSNDLLSDRAEMIADTSLAQTIHDGQRAAWSEMEAAGELPEQTMRIFRAGGDACDICLELDGATAELGEPYSGDGEVTDGPPVHPHCGCDEDLFVESGSGGSAADSSAEGDGAEA
jgi:hypothetical protein